MTTTSPSSPYVEPPTIPEGMTIEEYRRSRPQRRNPLLPPVLDWLSRLVSAPLARPT